VNQRRQFFLASLEVYTTMDTRLAWRLGKRVALAMVDRNLLDSERIKYYSLTPTFQLSQTHRGI